MGGGGFLHDVVQCTVSGMGMLKNVHDADYAKCDSDSVSESESADAT